MLQQNIFLKTFLYILDFQLWYVIMMLLNYRWPKIKKVLLQAEGESVLLWGQLQTIKTNRRLRENLTTESIYYKNNHCESTIRVISVHMCDLQMIMKVNWTSDFSIDSPYKKDSQIQKQTMHFKEYIDKHLSKYCFNSLKNNIEKCNIIFLIVCWDICLDNM